MSLFTISVLPVYVQILHLDENKEKKSELKLKNVKIISTNKLFIDASKTTKKKIFI